MSLLLLERLIAHVIVTTCSGLLYAMHDFRGRPSQTYVDTSDRMCLHMHYMYLDRSITDLATSPSNPSYVLTNQGRIQDFGKGGGGPGNC